MRDYPDPNQLPPKPASRPQGQTWLQRIRLFRQDVLSSQPERLYRAKMAHVKTPLFDSFLINTPQDARSVLTAPNESFPKSNIVGAGLRDLLGNSIFVSNGEEWARARRIIDTVFDGKKIKRSFPCIIDAGQAAVDRLSTTHEPVEIEAEASRLAADVIFRVLFSRPITDEDASRVFTAFQTYQRTQPLWNLADILRLPRWVPRFRNRQAKHAATEIRQILGAMIDQRLEAPKPWPEDMLSGLIANADPVQKTNFSRDELIDQIAIFFLAGHETSASALSWALYLLANDPSSQDRVAKEASTFDHNFSDLSKLGFTRNVFRETLRLYPPVPMMLRDADAPWQVRGRAVAKGSLIILSPWHLGRHEDLWAEPDAFDPDRWEADTPKFAHLPFSAGPRGCVGASFAMAEGVALLSQIVAAFEINSISGVHPIPVAHLTLRSKDGIWLTLKPRAQSA